MARLNIQDPPLPGAGSSRQFYLLGYDRRGIDTLIIIGCYVLMPFALVAALLRMLTTHYKNQRKASNYSLLFHAFLGGFIELSLISFIDPVEFGVMFICVLAFIFLIPAFVMGRLSAKAKYKFSALCHAYIVMVKDEGIRYIGTLAERTGQSERDVRRDLLFLQQEGLITEGTAFYEGTSPGRETNQSDVGERIANGLESLFGSTGRSSASSQREQTPPKLPKAVRCPGCGAQNTVQPEQAKPCEYCGTTLTYPV